MKSVLRAYQENERKTHEVLQMSVIGCIACQECMDPGVNQSEAYMC